MKTCKHCGKEINEQDPNELYFEIIRKRHYNKVIERQIKSVKQYLCDSCGSKCYYNEE